jgi:ribosomal-protein-alanine N-acetyltransferase
MKIRRIRFMCEAQTLAATKMQNKKIEILPMTANDLEAVAEIELLSGLNQWGVESYKSELAKNENLLYVAKSKEKTIGFVFARLITPIVEIINIAVLPEFRKQGIGHKLFETILAKGVESGCRECWLEVRESNETARRFYEKLNFQNVGRRKKYYSFPVEDALLLNYKIVK